MNADQRTAWLTERRKGIGGSDISAILGISKWTTPLDVWYDKTGRDPLDSGVDSEPMLWGRVLEDVIAREWGRRTGAKVQRITAVLTHPEQPIFRGSIDRAVVRAGSRASVLPKGGLRGADGVLEVKAVGAHMLEQWGGEGTGEETVPVHYAAQGQWYLGLSGLPWVEFAALIGGQRLITRRMQRDDELIAHMQDRALIFWRDHVLADRMPEPVNEADVRRLFPRDTGRLMEAGGALRSAVQDLRALTEQSKAIEAQIDALKEAIKVSMVDAAVVTIDGKPAVTWKASKDGVETDWQLVADDLRAAHGITPEAFAVALNEHTATKPGTRRFLIK